MFLHDQPQPTTRTTVPTIAVMVAFRLFRIPTLSVTGRPTGGISIHPPGSGCRIKYDRAPGGSQTLFARVGLSRDAAGDASRR